MLAIKATAVLTIWSGAAHANIGDVTTIIEKLKPELVQISQPEQSHPQTFVAGDICTLPLSAVVQIPKTINGENVIALACIHE
jgi:hypothetical protein